MVPRVIRPVPQGAGFLSCGEEVRSMFKPVDSRASFPEMEKRILQLWRCYRHPDPPKAEKGLAG